MTTGTTITLTTDVELQAKLTRKLEEYERRIAFKAPELDPHGTYKRDILKHLIEFGIVDLGSMMRAASQVNWFDDRAFLDAFNIVKAYNDNTPEKLFGGTGL